jgi:hypothetical protein
LGYRVLGFQVRELTIEVHRVPGVRGSPSPEKREFKGKARGTVEDCGAKRLLWSDAGRDSRRPGLR